MATEVDRMSAFRHETKLKDGTPVLIRLYQPSDISEVQLGLEKLSDMSLQLRFMTSLRNLPDDQLKKLKRIDHEHHIAICAFDTSQDPMIGVGIARYVRVEKEPHIAEAAITVIDEYQNRGLGTELLYQLGKIGLEKGIHFLRAHVLSNNTPIITIAKRAGAKITHYEGSVLQIDIPVSEAIELMDQRRT
ncbi:MAG: GNAT family N-acetyltransferase [Candidatus Thorarchaeota archaeon]